MRPICMRCGLLLDLPAEWIEAQAGDRRLDQIDSGEDFMFRGLMVTEPAPTRCPRCTSTKVVLVRPADAEPIGKSIEHLARRQP